MLEALTVFLVILAPPIVFGLLAYVTRNDDAP
jgi:hypothetical protein